MGERSGGKYLVASRMLVRKGRLGLRRIIFGAIYLMYREQVNCCPACTSTDVESFSKVRWHLSFLKLVRCKSCKFIWQSPRLSKRGLDFFYQKLYRSRKSSAELESLYQRGRRRGAYILDFVRSAALVRKPKLVVEIGCGYGGIMDRFQTWADEVIGYDIDPKACQFAQMKGLQVRQGDIEAVRENGIDVFLCSHVLEHVVDPIRFLTSVVSKLSRPGLIYIEVPGVENPKVVEDNFGAQPGHLHYFTRQTLEACCKKADLDIVKINDKIQVVAIPKGRVEPRFGQKQINPK